VKKQERKMERNMRESRKERKKEGKKERKKRNTGSNAVFSDVSFIKLKKKILQLPIKVANPYGEG
jgi:hypothetical protein